MADVGADGAPTVIPALVCLRVAQSAAYVSDAEYATGDGAPDVNIRGVAATGRGRSRAQFVSKCAAARKSPTGCAGSGDAFGLARVCRVASARVCFSAADGSV